MNELPSVSFAAFEAMRTGYERTIKRMLIVLFVAIAMVFASNLAWLWFWSQYEIVDTVVDETYSQEGEGRFNINTGEQGGVYYGETDLQADGSGSLDDPSGE